MFDPSQQLHDYFVQKGYSDLEAHREANKVSGRCPPMWLRAKQQTERTPVSSADTKHNMSETYDSPAEVPVGQDSEIIDLGFDVSEADVARPVIKNGNYNANIAFVRRANSSQKNIPQLLVGYKLLEPTKDLQGRDINAGFTITQRIMLQPSGKLTQEMIQDRLKRVHFAAVGPGRVTTAEWVGKPVRVRVTLREPHRDEATGEEYDASNDIGGVYPPPKSAEAEA
jgi:hypothetical protein